MNLQKDEFTDAWFVNLGIWIVALGESRTPQCHHCHVQIRAPELWPDRAHDIEDLFDLGREDLADEDWKAKLEAFAETDLAPKCRRLVQKEVLIDTIRSEMGAKFQVMLVARDWLEMPELSAAG